LKLLFSEIKVMKGKGLIVEKQNTETTTDMVTATDITTTYESDDEYYSETEDTSTQTGGKKYITVSRKQYKKPPQGSMQDNFTKEEILRRLQNCIPLKTMQEKSILNDLPIFKTWIRYYNVEKRLFRVGGLLLKSGYPEYIMLINPNQNVSWSVQLKDNIIYIQDPRKQEMTRKQKEEERREKKEKERLVKEKLYEMYQNGRLAVKK
jgi:phage protein D